MEIIGKSASGVVHLIDSESKRPICSLRSRPLEQDSGLTILSVNCRNCMRLGAYQSLLAKEVEPKPKKARDTEETPSIDQPNEEVISEDSAPIEEVPEELPASEVLPLVAKEDQAKAVYLEIDSNQPYSKIVIGIPPEEHKPPYIEDYIIDEISKIDLSVVEKRTKEDISSEIEFSRAVMNVFNRSTFQFKALLNSDLTYSIIHRVGGQVFFSSVKRNHIASCLVALNDIEIFWSGRGSISSELLEEIKVTFALGYHASSSPDDNIISIKAKDKEIPSAANDPVFKLVVPKRFANKQSTKAESTSEDVFKLPIPKRFTKK